MLLLGPGELVPSGSAGASYLELMTLAQRYVRIAIVQLATDAIVTAEDAAHAVRCQRELVHALGSQARLLAGPRTQTRWTLESAYPDPIRLATARLVHALENSVRNRPVRPELVSADSLARHYKSAAVAVRTATDLLLIQTDPSGRPRTPEAEQLLSPRGRIVALDDVAAVAELLAASRQTLHEQVRMRAQRYATGTVPDLTAVQTAATQVREFAAGVLADDPSAQEVLALRTVPDRRWSPIRTPDPVEEVQGHLNRLRQTAWDLMSTETLPSVSTQALTDFAVTGIAVNTGAAVTGARLAGVGVRDSAIPVAVQRYLTKAVAWRTVRGGLLLLNTTGHHDPNISLEARDTLRLASRMAPAERGTGIARPDREQVFFAALQRASEVMDQIARWNSQTLSRLASAGDLFMPGRLLTGAEVTDNPHLVTAKLVDRPVQASAEMVEAILASYRSIGAANQPIAAGPVLGIQPGIQPPDLHA